MKRRSRFFKLKIESISDFSAVMLDLEISKGVRFKKTGCLDIGIHVKSTSQGAALSSKSCHLPSVHESWPISRLLHYQSCCSHVSFFRVAALKFLSKIKASDSDHPCLTRVAEAIVHGRPVSNDSVSRMKMNSKCTRLIVPYHPSLGGLNAMCFRFSRYLLRPVFRIWLQKWCGHFPARVYIFVCLLILVLNLAYDLGGAGRDLCFFVLQMNSKIKVIPVIYINFPLTFWLKSCTFSVCVSHHCNGVADSQIMWT